MEMNTDEIREWIIRHTEEYCQEVAGLVRFPSVSQKTSDQDRPFGKACADILDYALSKGENWGFEAYNHKYMCGSLLWRGKDKKEIGIFGHLDVVPAGTGWEYPPFELTVKDGFLIGRGCADNKGSMMAALFALRYLKETGYQPVHSIRFFMGCAEETGMEDIVYYTEHNQMPEYSIVADSVFPVCYGEKGILEVEARCPIKSRILQSFEAGVASNSVPERAEAVLKISVEIVKIKIPEHLAKVEECEEGSLVSVEGIAAHAAFPQGSQSAEVKLAQILLSSGLLDEEGNRLMLSILDLFQDYYGAGLGIAYEDEIFGKLTHIGGMARTSGGWLYQNINIRYNAQADYEEMMHNIEKSLKYNGFELIAAEGSKPSYVDPESSLVRILNRVASAYYPESKPFVMGGGTYARKLDHAVGFGPGAPNGRNLFGAGRGGGHQPDECIAMQELLTAMEIYIAAIPELDELTGGN